MASEGTETVQWDCTITSSAPLLGDSGVNIEIIVIDADTGAKSEAASVNGWLPPQMASKKDGSLGWKRNGVLSLPASIRSVGALLLRKTSESSSASVDYIGAVDLVSSKSACCVIVRSWVSSEHGWRVFFGLAALLPKDTPPWLAAERDRDLEELRGSEGSRLAPRKGADRIYWYQTYNDLGTKEKYRPPLGGSKNFPYPRRLATNRGWAADGSETTLGSPNDKPWIPFDEQFSFIKAKGFQGDLLAGIAAAAFTSVAEAGDQRNLTLLNLLPTALRGVVNVIAGVLKVRENPLANYEDFMDVLAMFKLDVGESFPSLVPKHLYDIEGPRELTPASRPGALQPSKEIPERVRVFRLPPLEADRVNDLVARNRVGPVYDSASGLPAPGAHATRQVKGKPPKPGAPDVVDRLGDDVWQRVKNASGDVNQLLYFAVPRLLSGRADVWYTDEEFGRQALAGYNPVTVTALRELPAVYGSAIREEHVKAELQGSSLKELVQEAKKGGKPRLYWQDYWDLAAFWGEDPSPEEDKIRRVPHRGRALYYLQKDDQGQDCALVPVAIELAHPGTHSLFPSLDPRAGVVYARSELAYSTNTLVVWRLAKAVFKSMDSSVHQVYSHFTRAHAATEPFFIALRRNISTLHPVFKLMAPHFRYTLDINRSARSGLINAGGIIERCFTPGKHALRLGAILYGKAWTFAGEALPDDLRARGMVDQDGKPWLDYPFAEDGLELWREIDSYFDKYIRLYYGSDDDVKADTELQAWWHEVKTEGHPDLVKFGLRTEAEVWGFEGPIPTIPKLVHVLTTIAWVASGHHAAINFGQYDYLSLILNTSSLIRRPMPAPGDQAYQELTRASAGSPQECIFMTYLADPLSAVQVMATIQLLSTHADDEQTLDEPNEYLTDPRAVDANWEFMKAMKALDVRFHSRNVDPANWARYSLGEGPHGPNLPYTLLMPSSGAGVTMRGVPYSVSI